MMNEETNQLDYFTKQILHYHIW